MILIFSDAKKHESRGGYEMEFRQRTITDLAELAMREPLIHAGFLMFGIRTGNEPNITDALIQMIFALHGKNQDLAESYRACLENRSRP